MIFYFTATGNSLSAASAIAAVTDDRLYDIGTATKERIATARETFPIELPQRSDIGFVFPVQAWTTPGIIDDFVRRVRFRTGDGEPFVPGYVWCVLTCGAFVGNAARFFGQMLAKYQKMTLDASFTVKSQGNCVYLYDMAQGERLDKTLEAASAEERAVAAKIAAGERAFEERRNPFGELMSKKTCKEDAKKRSVAPFHVNGKCTGCGICAEVCPTETIHMVEGKPVWDGDACTQCLACLHRCPVHASQYGKRTEKRRRYLNPILKSRKTSR